MSKILYIAPVRDFSGYANAARGYIKALHMAGADLVVRPVRYDRADAGSEYSPEPWEKELLQKPLKDIDIVMQHVTPNEMRPVPSKVNIAVVAWETTKIPDYWAKKLNQFDSVITFCDASVKAFRDSGVTSPIFKVPHSFDIDSYDLTNIEPISSPGAEDLFKDRFVFYNISQLSAKKGIDILLRAYYYQFHGRKNDVILILKTYMDMNNRDQEKQRIAQYIQSAKNAMRLPEDGYPPVMLITSTLSDEQIRKLHKTGDCYVCSSRAEGWCIPAFDALASNNKLVTTSWGGMGEFAAIKDEDDWGKLSDDQARENVYLVNYSMEPLVGQHHSDPDLYTGKDLIAEPSVRSMAIQMETAMNSELLERPDLSDFSHQNVGPKMLEAIAATVAESTMKEKSNV